MQIFIDADVRAGELSACGKGEGDIYVTVRGDEVSWEGKGQTDRTTERDVGY